MHFIRLLCTVYRVLSQTIDNVIIGSTSEQLSLIHLLYTFAAFFCHTTKFETFNPQLNLHKHFWWANFDTVWKIGPSEIKILQCKRRTDWTESNHNGVCMHACIWFIKLYSIASASFIFLFMHFVHTAHGTYARCYVQFIFICILTCMPSKLIEFDTFTIESS